MSTEQEIVTRVMRAKDLCSNVGLSMETKTWEDVSRFNALGWGNGVQGDNISDWWLQTRGGTNCPKVSSPRLQDRVAVMSIDKVSLIAGDPARPISLRDYLQQFSQWNPAYDQIDLSKGTAEELCTVRMISALVPMPEDRKWMDLKLVCKNYNTSDARHPQSIFALSDHYGVSTTEARPGQQTVLPLKKEGFIQKKYFMRMVPKEQESAAQKAQQESVLGVQASGRGKNRTLLIQIPLKQVSANDTGMCLGAEIPNYCLGMPPGMSIMGGTPGLSFGGSGGAPAAPRGLRPANLYRGDSAGDAYPIYNKQPRRDTSKNVTLTLMSFHQISDTLTADELARISQQHDQYYATPGCKWQGSLVQGGCGAPKDAQLPLLSTWPCS